MPRSVACFWVLRRTRKYTAFRILRTSKTPKRTKTEIVAGPFANKTDAVEYQIAWRQRVKEWRAEHASLSRQLWSIPIVPLGFAKEWAKTERKRLEGLLAELHERFDVPPAPAPEAAT